MKIYFTASARGQKQYLAEYSHIYKVIEECGHTNIDKLVLSINPDDFYQGTKESQIELYENTIKLIKTADVVILEVSIPSLSIGFVIDKALESGKPVIALYKKGNNVFFLEGVEDDKLQVVEYDSDNLKNVIQSALDYAKDQADIRFNFFISPKISNYLDWISKEKRIPRSVYLRRLIETDMNKSEEYKELV